MAVLLVDKAMGGSLNFTDTDLYDILILPEAEGIATKGQVISSFGEHVAGLIEGLESFSLSLGKADVTLSVGGNYIFNKGKAWGVSDSRWDGQWYDEFASTYQYGMSDNYNINHVQFNDNYISGAVQFRGTDAHLVLTAQNGAGLANKYHTSENPDYIWKMDDALAFRSANFGIYSVYKEKTESRTSYAYYAQATAPTAPGEKTINYGFHALGTLTVESDLAGIFESTVAALHAGYKTQSDSKDVSNDDSSGNQVVTAGIKANKLVLESNFRAQIYSWNNDKSFAEGTGSALTVDKKTPIDPKDDHRVKIYEPKIVPDKDTPAAANSDNDGEDEDHFFIDKNADGSNAEYGVVGTTIAGHKTPTANNNKINSYGIWVDDELSVAEKSIWAGTISATCDLVNIIASHKYQAATDDGKKADRSTASATGNEIGAYGIRVDGTLNISQMGALYVDAYDADGMPVYDLTQAATITVSACNNEIIVEAAGTKDKEATATLDATITAAGIYAETLNLGAVSHEVTITVNADNNRFVCTAVSGKKNSYSLSTALNTYGIYADNANLRDFDGVIKTQARGTQSSVEGTKVTDSSGQLTSGIFVANTLQSSNNLGGTISVSGSGYRGKVKRDVDKVGIDAKTITVDGVIDTVITGDSGAFGILVGQELNADAFTGYIKTAGTGINISSGGLGKDKGGDALDIAGEIYTSDCAISCLDTMNIRVSGKITVSSGGYAIHSEIGLTKSTTLVGNYKYEDRVEFTETAEVTGNIELGALVNEVIVSSGARVNGSVLANGGEVNFTFNLEDEVNDSAAILVKNLHEDDKTIKDAATVTINLNYAVDGTYKLIQYQYDASEYWVNRQIAFMYQGNNVMVQLGEELNGFADMFDIYGNKVGTVTAEFADNTLQVRIEKNQEITTKADADDIIETYDAKKETLKLDWTGIFSQSDYDYLPTIYGYEIEYYLYDKDGAKLGESISVTLDASEKSYTIKGVANNTKVDWRIRLLGDSSRNTLTGWSDKQTVSNQPVPESAEGAVSQATTYVENPVEFSEDTFITKVIDANPRNSEVTGVVAAIADLSWGKLDSQDNFVQGHMSSSNTIRNYVLQYCTLNDQITLEDALSAGYESLEDYIANGLEMTYTKVVTGSSVAVSNLQNQTYVYWKIQAIDTFGNTSDWVAGETFRVWANNDTTAPVFINDNISGMVVGYDRFDDLEQDTTTWGVFAWNPAADTESGVRAYNIEKSIDGGKTWSVWKTVDAEDQVTMSIAEYQDNSLDVNGEYQVILADGTLLKATVSVATVNQEEVRTLKWYTDPAGAVGGFTIQKFNGTEFVDIAKNGNYKHTEYAYSANLDGFTDPQYTFRIQAVDYFGKTSNWHTSESVVLDAKAPLFTNDRTEVVLDINREDKNFIATFRWGAASDADAMGLRYYKIEYREADSDEWLEVESFAADDPRLEMDENGFFSYRFNDVKLPANVYEYRVSAVDWFGRSDEITGTFGSNDMTPPEGAFVRGSFKSNVSANYEDIYGWVDEPVLDANGEELLDANGDPMVNRVYKVIGHRLIDAEVTLDWQDTFSDDAGVIYKITVSSDSNFQEGPKTYAFYTPVNSGSQFTFNNSTPGCPVGIFENMKDVYWFVQVFDANGNTASEISDLQSFKFASEYGAITSNELPAAPGNIVLNTDNMIDGVHSDKVGISWNSSNTLMGIYSYTVEMYDANGKVLKYSGNTVDLSDNLTTDMSTMVTVSNNGSYNTMSIADLRKFFGVAEIADGNYKVMVSSLDASGRVSKSEKVDLTVDTTRPEYVNITESFAIAENRNGSTFSNLVIRWKPLTDAVSGIEKYEISYWQQDGEVTTVTVGGDVSEYSLMVGGHDAPYFFEVIAIDGSGNRGFASERVTVKPTPDKFSDSVNNPEKIEFAAGEDHLVLGDHIDAEGLRYLETVGKGDVADTFSIDVKENTMALSLTVDDLKTLVGSSKGIKISIYEGRSTSKAWKTFTVKSDSRVITDLLLQANTTYTFSITNLDTKNSVSEYRIALDKNDLPNDNSDDTLNDARKNDKTFRLTSDAGKISDWVGYGDAADVRILDVAVSGRYSFTLKDVAASAKLTVYQIVDGKAKSIGTVTAAQSKLDGVTTKDLILEANGDYYVEVKATNAKAYGSSYTVDIACKEAYPAVGEADTGDDNFGGEAELYEGVLVSGGYVGISDTVDIYKLDGKFSGNYQLKLDGIAGKEITVAMGWYDSAKGKFNKIVSKTGAANTDELILSLSDAEFFKANGDMYIQVSANGKTANSLYDLSLEKNENIAGFYTGDNTVSKNNPLLEAGHSENNWVGLGDDTDYYKLALNGSGMYNIAITGAENPLKVTLYKSVNGKMTALKNITLTAAAGKDSGMLANLLLNGKEDYYVAVVGSGASKGQNSDYSIALDAGNTAEALMTVTREENVTLTKAGESMIFTAPETGGAYKFTVNADDMYVGSVKLTVYELLTTGKTRTVKTITVKAGAEGTTGYLYFADTAVKNGTGVYQVEVKAANASSGGDCTVKLEGYDFGKYLAGKNDPLEFGERDWVGMGDTFDSAKMTFTQEIAGVYNLKLTGINGNNLKLLIVDKATGNTKTFTPAANTSEAVFGYEFKKGNYEIRVESADGGKAKFSEYTLELESRAEDIAKSDNGFDAKLQVLDRVDNAVEGWVGLNDAKDYYLVNVDETGNYNFAINDLSNDVKVVLYDANRKQYKTLTAKAADNGSVLSEVLLEAGKNYYVMMQSSATNGLKDSEYSLMLEQAWAFEADTAVNDTAAAAKENGALASDGMKWKAEGCVRKGVDDCDYYMITVTEDGNYTLDLKGINGNTIAASIGTMDAKGNFKSLKKVTGKAGADSLVLQRDLTAGTYYVKVESVTKNTASHYELEMTLSENKPGYSNNDDTWKLTAADVEAETYGLGDAVGSYLGYGDAADVFKIKISENGVVTFDAEAETLKALQAKQLSLALYDANGKSVALAFDAESGEYTTKTILMADVEYYLSVKNNKSSQLEMDFSIAIK